MALTVKKTGGDFEYELPPAGNHIALCYMVCDLGDHEEEFQGQSKTLRKVRLSWELAGEFMADGRPFSVSNKYTMSLSDKANLRKHLEAWRGRPFSEQELQGFDLFTILGAPCMLNVTHKPWRTDPNKFNAVVASIAPLPKGVPKPALANATVAFSLDEPDAIQQFNRLPEWLQKLINHQGLTQPQSRQTPPAAEQHDYEDYPESAAFEDDDIPF